MSNKEQLEENKPKWKCKECPEIHETEDGLVPFICICGCTYFNAV